MSLTSLNFIGFVCIAVLLFMVFPKKYRWISLLVSSIAFYLISDYRCMIFVIVSTVSVFFGARGISGDFTKEQSELEGIEDKQAKKDIKAKHKKKRKVYLWLTLCLNIGILVCLKILKFKNIPLPVLSFDGANTDAMAILMPLGISYYTFSITGYLLDIYWKRYDCETNFARFLNWTIYFPHIVQGPISRYNRLGTELKKELPLKWDNFKYGLELILWGFFKKLVIADRIAIFVNNVYESNEEEYLIIGSVSFMLLVLDAIQIYTDFSGYVDIVTGVSQIFGVELEQNFNRPFMSRTVPEFWRRWHMSLGGWFRDYVYYPISVSKVCKGISKKLRGKVSDRIIGIIVTLIPVMITWILTGLWHGTGRGYLMWGVYYGLLIACSVLFRQNFDKFLHKIGINTECFSWKLLQRIKIFFIFMGGRLLANPIGMMTRKIIVTSIVKDFFSLSWGMSKLDEFGLNLFNFGIIAFGVVLLIIVAIMQEKGSVREWLGKQNFLFQAIVITIAIYLVFLLGVYGSTYNVGSFMYQQF